MINVTNPALLEDYPLAPTSESVPIRVAPAPPAHIQVIKDAAKPLGMAIMGALVGAVAAYYVPKALDRFSGGDDGFDTDGFHSGAYDFEVDD